MVAFILIIAVIVSAMILYSTVDSSAPELTRAIGLGGSGGATSQVQSAGAGYTTAANSKWLVKEDGGNLDLMLPASNIIQSADGRDIQPELHVTCYSGTPYVYLAAHGKLREGHEAGSPVTTVKMAADGSDPVTQHWTLAKHDRMFYPQPKALVDAAVKMQDVSLTIELAHTRPQKLQFDVRGLSDFTPRIQADCAAVQ